jgi:hypothetical protein
MTQCEHAKQLMMDVYSRLHNTAAPDRQNNMLVIINHAFASQQNCFTQLN